MRCLIVSCTAMVLAGCAAADAGRPQSPTVAAPSQAPVASAPVARIMPPPPDQTEVLRAALGTWPQCRAEILGFVGLTSLARELGDEGEIFADAIDGLSDQVADCIKSKDDDDGLIRS
jgi:hypothetical protein